MRTLILIAGVCLAAAACSKSDADRIGQDTKAVGHDVAAEARKVGQDPATKAAATDIKDAGRATADALRHSAAVADVKVKQAAANTDAELRKTDREARRAEVRERARDRETEHQTN